MKASVPFLCSSVWPVNLITEQRLTLLFPLSHVHPASTLPAKDGCCCEICVYTLFPTECCFFFLFFLVCFEKLWRRQLENMWLKIKIMCKSSTFHQLTLAGFLSGLALASYITILHTRYLINVPGLIHRHSQRCIFSLWKVFHVLDWLCVGKSSVEAISGGSISNWAKEPHRSASHITPVVLFLLLFSSL